MAKAEHLQPPRHQMNGTSGTLQAASASNAARERISLIAGLLSQRIEAPLMRRRTARR
jgi:hypothetical protein